MRNSIRLTVLAAGLAAAAAPMAMQAQEVRGPHPDYLHALSDLRAARHYLNDGWTYQAVRQEDGQAIHYIDLAIIDIKKASIDDGKGDNDPFPIDAHLNAHDRWQKANELLQSAHNDLAHAEDVPAAQQQRGYALQHIEQAHTVVDRAARTAHWD